METLLIYKIIQAYKNVTDTRESYRIQDLADWINETGGVNGRLVTRAEVKRGILAILDKGRRQ